MKFQLAGMAKLVLDENNLTFASLGIRWSGSPLHIATRNSVEESVDILLEAGADPTIKCPGWISVLHLIPSGMGPIVSRVNRLEMPYGMSNRNQVQ